MKKQVNLTIHANGDVSTDYCYCDTRLIYHHSGGGRGYLDKEHRDGRILYAYGSWERTKFILEQCEPIQAYCK